MNDKYIGEQKLIDVLLEQFHSYHKLHGNEPTTLVFGSQYYYLKFDNEARETLMFSNPIVSKKFMGMEIVFLKNTYGGSFNWGFGE